MNTVISERISELMSAYPALMISEETEEYISLSGIIGVHRSVEQFVINKNYKIDIFIPKREELLPYVVDAGKEISTKYPHIYTDGRLCLATDIDIRLALCNDPSLVNWVRNYVETYFVSYEYYERYGVFPLGERTHGAYGIVQSYMEIFGVSMEKAMKIILFLSYDAYRGNRPCPCGSQIRMRKCHGKELLVFYNNPILLEQVRLDCKMMAKEVFQNEFAQQ